LSTSSAFGDRVRVLRTATRLTQADLAERAGISERTVSDIERGLRQAVYSDTARRLADALGLQADERAAFEAMSRARDNAPATAPDHPDGWSGIRRTPLIGREREVDAVCAAVTDNDVRLMTVTGPGGIGKTRVAAEACARIESVERGRVVFVSLAALRDPSLVLSTVARVLGLPDTGAGIANDLARYLAARRAVLVLDTFEQVLDAGPMVGTLLDRIPDLTVLATSRAPLRLRGERELPLGPLPVRPPGASGAYPAELLFQDRALAARPDLVLDVAAQEVVAEVCRRLGGVPLALELAAARVRHMSLMALRSQLDKPLRLLTGGVRDLPARQQTIRATLDWSHDLLSPGERIVFRRLACFAGGWTLEASEAVCGEPGEAQADVLGALGALVEHGLVLADAHAVTARWSLLDPIRDYATERLREAGENRTIARQHAEYYAKVAEQAEPYIRAGAQSQWQDLLRAESGNEREALRWTLASGEAELALRLGAGLWMFWRLEGAFGEGRSWLEGALALDGAEDSPQRARALWGAAWLAYQQADHDRTTALGQELEALSEASDQPLDRRNALTILGHVLTARGQTTEAVPLLEEALQISRTVASRWHIAASLLNLGTAVLHHGEVARAQQLLEQAVDAYGAVGDRHFAAHSLVELGYSSLVATDFDGAAARFAGAMGEFVALGERWGIVEALDGFAAVAAGRGQHERTGILSGAAEAASATIAARGLALDMAIARPLLAKARAALGELAWNTAVDRGRALSVERAAELALGDSSDANQDIAT